MLNKNDFKYILKRVIIFLIIALLIAFFGSCNAKADTVLHATYASTRICNTEFTSGCTSGNSTLSNANPNSEIISVQVGNRWETQTISYGLLFQYNNNKRPIDTYINFPFNSGLTGLVFEFSYLSQLPSGQTAGQGALVPIYAKVQYTDGEQEKCVISNITNTNYNEEIYFEERGFKCVFNKEPAVIIIQYQSNGSNYTNLKYYVSYNNYVRAPYSDDELEEYHQAMMNQARINSNAITNLWNSIDDNTETGNLYLPSWFSDMQNRMDSNSVISSLVTLPITFLQAFLSGFNGTCQRYDLGTIYGQHLYLPCITLSTYLGQNLVSIIDVICSGMMIFVISKKMVNIFDDLTNLRTNQIDELYGGGA